MPHSTNATHTDTHLADTPSTPSDPAVKNVVLAVPDISCVHCQVAIESAVAALDGVVTVDVSIADHIVTVEFDPACVKLSGIVTAIHEQGYEISDM